MSTHAILNNVEHNSLTVADQRQCNFDNHHMCAALTLSELRAAVQDYPILFYRSPNESAPEPMAIFGFEKNENLFISESGWSNHFIPAIIAKGPFKIGHQQDSSGEMNQVVSVDMEDPRVNTIEGLPLFLPHGGHSDYLVHILDNLHRLATERPDTLAFGKALLDAELLESVNIEFNVNSEESTRLTGFMTINEEKLNNLSGDALESLAKKGYLQAAYFCIAAMSNLGPLIQRKQQKESN